MSPRPSSSSNDELENQSFKLALFLMNKQMIYVISFVFSDTCGAIESSMSHFLSSRQTKKKNSSLIQDDSEFGSWPTLCVDYSMGYESHL